MWIEIGITGAWFATWFVGSCCKVCRSRSFNRSKHANAAREVMMSFALILVLCFLQGSNFSRPSRDLRKYGSNWQGTESPQTTNVIPAAAANEAEKREARF